MIGYFIAEILEAEKCKFLAFAFVERSGQLSGIRWK